MSSDECRLDANAWSRVDLLRRSLVMASSSRDVRSAWRPRRGSGGMRRRTRMAYWLANWASESCVFDSVRRWRFVKSDRNNSKLKQQFKDTDHIAALTVRISIKYRKKVESLKCKIYINLKGALVQNTSCETSDSPRKISWSPISSKTSW